MSKTIAGGCLCGKVRYTFSTEPIFSGNCHCRDCQKASGAAFTSAMFVAEDAVAISGEVKYFESQADSGRKVSRGFCPTCGSQLLSKLEMLPNFIGLRAGTFDHPNDFEPQMDIFTASAACWTALNPDLPKFAKAPK